jgi:type II secretory pathway component PulM
VRVQTILKIIGAVILLVFVWLAFNPTSSELRSKHKETLLKKRIEKSVEEVKEIDKEMQRLKGKDDY